MDKDSIYCGSMVENHEQSVNDRISQFPDEILVAIVSNLPLRDAGRTSILSPRWKNLWTHIPRLNYEAESVLYTNPETMWSLVLAEKNVLLREERFQNVLCVTKILLSYQAPKLEELSLRFDLDKQWQFFLNVWIKQAFAKKVQRLNLDFSSETLYRDAEESCRFPEEFFTNSLVEPSPFPLPIQLLDDILETEITFESLRVLSLIYVNVSGEGLEFILRNCPFLEELVVCYSDKLTNLEVSGSSLKLKLLEIRRCRKLASLKVCNAKNLRSLSIIRSTGVIMLENLPMLVNVSVDSTSTDFFVYVFDMLSCCLSQLEVLNLCGGKPKEIVKVSVFPDFAKLKKLVLKFWADRNNNFVDLVSFVKSAPLLEEFILELMWIDPSKNEKQVEIAAGTPHQFLKVVNISGYCGRIGELELVKYLLKNAIVLEKIIVDPKRNSATSRNPPPPDVELASEQIRRKFVLEQLEAEVPEHIQLVVL